jgi:hypothetical protein
MTPDIVISIPITNPIPNALDPNPTRAMIIPAMRVMDPTRYFQKRNYSPLANNLQTGFG